MEEGRKGRVVRVIKGSQGNLRVMDAFFILLIAMTYAKAHQTLHLKFLQQRRIKNSPPQKKEKKEKCYKSFLLKVVFNFHPTSSEQDVLPCSEITFYVRYSTIPQLSG